MERLNRTIISILATMVNDYRGKLEDHLPRVCFTDIVSEQKLTAFCMMFGRQARMPLDIMYGTPVSEAKDVNHYI